MSIESLLAAIRPMVAGLVASLPFLRRLKAEREAGVNPEAAKDPVDELVDGALGRLGSRNPDRSLMEKIADAVGARLTRPEHFKKPHFVEWLSHPDSREALRRIVKAQIAGSLESKEDREAALAKYIEITGEHRRIAESHLDTAAACIKTSVFAASKDRGVAALIIASSEASNRGLDEVLEAVKEVRSHMPAMTSGSAAAMSDHHNKDAEAALASVLKRRGSLGRRSVTELLMLSDNLREDGAYPGASPDLRANVLDWIVRLAAVHEMLDEAEKAFVALARLGRKAAPVSMAWLQAARGKVDSALQELRDLDTDQGRTAIFGLLRLKKGTEAALAYLGEIDITSPGAFTPVGWASVIELLSKNGQWERSAELAKALPEYMVAEWPLLAYTRGMTHIALSVAPEIRERLFEDGYLAVTDHLLDGEDASRCRTDAAFDLECCSQSAHSAGDISLAGNAEECLRWLRLVDPQRRTAEIDALSAELGDGAKAVDLIQLALAFAVKFDTAALSQRLDRMKMLGGLTAKELNAKVLLLRHEERFAELASFVEENWGRLVEAGSEQALGGALVEAHARAGDYARAEEALKTHRERLHPSDVPRFEMMIAQCRGEDPTRLARDTFENNGRQIVDLINLVGILSAKGRWDELTPLAKELFDREPSTANALRVVRCMARTGADKIDLMRFLDARPDLVEADMELMSTKAWILFHLGRVAESVGINRVLLDRRFDANDVALEVNLSVRTGDWDHLPGVLDRVWDKRNDLPVPLLLHIARLTFSRAKGRCLELVRESVERDPDNPRVLLQAYSVAAAMGEDDVGIPLVAKAAALSKDGKGPVVSLSLKEVAEMMKGSADDWRGKNELFRSGNVPIHWAAALFNVPLSRLLIAIPRENRSCPDARRRQPIPIVSGSRAPAKAEGIRTIALDITSAMILGELGVLSTLVERMDKTMFSPRFMESLLFEEEKVRFHQPSRIEDAKPLLEWVRSGVLGTVGDRPSAETLAEVGEEDGALLQAALRSGGVSVHAGRLYRPGSYMEQESQLGDMAKVASTPIAVARALKNEGVLTESECAGAVGYLERVCPSAAGEAEPKPGCPVYLDRVSAENLAAVNLLEPLANSGREVFIHAGAEEEWRALVDTERHSDAMVRSLEGLREVVRNGLANGKVGFLREGRERDDDEARFGMHDRPMMDLFEDVSEVDAVCVDDRLINANARMEDRSGVAAKLLCSLDLIRILANEGAVSEDKARSATHYMRKSCFTAIRVESTELLDWVSKASAGEEGILLESAELRVLREYLSRLHSSNFLCSRQDLDYMDSLWRTGMVVVRQIWADDLSKVEDVVARADWVVEHVMPDPETTLRFAENGRDRVEELAAGRLFLALLPYSVPAGGEEIHRRWVEQRFVDPILPGSPRVVSKAVALVGSWARERAMEISHEFECRSGEGTGEGPADDNR